MAEHVTVTVKDNSVQTDEVIIHLPDGTELCINAENLVIILPDSPDEPHFLSLVGLKEGCQSVARRGLIA